MKLKIATIADYALVDQLGKMSVIGIYDVVVAVVFPAAPRLFVALRLECESADLDKDHALRVQVIDADGAAVGKDFRHQFAVARESTSEGARPSMQVIVDFSGLQIPSAGAYSFEIFVDDRAFGSVPLHVVQGKPLAQT